VCPCIACSCARRVKHCPASRGSIRVDPAAVGRTWAEPVKERCKSCSAAVNHHRDGTARSTAGPIRISTRLLTSPESGDIGSRRACGLWTGRCGDLWRRGLDLRRRGFGPVLKDGSATEGRSAKCAVMSPSPNLGWRTEPWMASPNLGWRTDPIRWTAAEERVNQQAGPLGRRRRRRLRRGGRIFRTEPIRRRGASPSAARDRSREGRRRDPVASCAACTIWPCLLEVASAAMGVSSRPHRPSSC
jgi:hypothetical protein